MDYGLLLVMLIFFLTGAVSALGLNCGSHWLCCKTPRIRNFWRD